eukprot:GHVU01032085.1.p1 GENE.GHVU01032085.1~~GHVU01032085.1.p1  ORF type:complete len:173 (+),score=5.66 GHVU01032085.1:313-831(+)
MGGQRAASRIIGQASPSVRRQKGPRSPTVRMQGGRRPMLRTPKVRIDSRQIISGPQPLPAPMTEEETDGAPIMGGPSQFGDSLAYMDDADVVHCHRSGSHKLCSSAAYHSARQSFSLSSRFVAFSSLTITQPPRRRGVTTRVPIHYSATEPIQAINICKEQPFVRCRYIKGA